jgi:hypothetical protein
MKPSSLCCLWLICCGLTTAAAADNPPVTLALLIGCSDYQHLQGKNLRGPKNDVKEFAQALTKRFGFAASDVRTLAAWPVDVTLRPTRANILRELDALAAKSAAGAQIVIAFSGHGTRIPIPDSQHPLDPTNPEPDGLDEAFVAADAQLVDGEMQNLILDNELGVHLQKIRAKGAHVWAVFDCCHSGTLARGVGDDATGEVSRELSADQLGITAAAVKKAETKAAGVKDQAAKDGDDLTIFDAPSEENQPGSLVAFYAAQPFETAPDLPCPAGAPKTDDHYFGLLTYSTLQTLLRERSAGKLTYRELGQAVIGRYRADRGTRGPTPNFAGDLDREVLGLGKWPGRSQLLLQKNDAGWAINAGELQGLSTGSILAAYPPATATQEDMPLGYVKVTNASPTSVYVEPCPFNQVAAIAASNLQDGMRCEIVSRQLGDLRLKVAIVGEGDVQSLVKLTRDLLQAAEDKLGAYLHVNDDPAADWQLRAVSPAIALADYRMKIETPQLFLIRRGEGGAAGRVWQQYDPRDAETFRTLLVADLQKVFTWQNLWRVAGNVGKEAASVDTAVKVELAKLTAADDTSGGKLLDNAEVKSGDFLELRVANDGANRIWVTLVFLDADFRVSVLPTEQLNRPGSAGSELEPIRFQITAKTPGPQSCLVIAGSAETNLLEPPDYRFLAQSRLGKNPKSEIAATRAGSSPFETLALAVAGQQGAFRGEVASSAQNPTLVLRSWLTKPSASKP